MARVAIGMPVYERSDYFEEALESLKRQTYRDIHVLVSDNASSHSRFAEIFDRLVGDDPRFVYVRQPVTIDVFDHYIYVFDNTKSKYFMWASDDDVWHEQFVERAVAVLDRSPRFCAWFCNIEGINGQGLVYRDYRSLKRFQSTFNKLSDLSKYLLEPEIVGKANLFYSVYSRVRLAGIVNKFRNPKTRVWGFDMIFIYAFICRYGLFVDESVLFQKREGHMTKYIDVVLPRLMTQHIGDVDGYFAGLVDLAVHKDFTKTLLDERLLHDRAYVAEMRAQLEEAILESPIEEARPRSF